MQTLLQRIMLTFAEHRRAGLCDEKVHMLEKKD